MNSTLKLPLEQLSREEAHQQKVAWSQGLANFLLQRTQEKYRLGAIEKRRLILQKQLGIQLPEITDKMLLALYKIACTKYMEKCNQTYGASSGFGRTSAESTFSKTLTTVIENNPKLKHLEIYPSQSHSKDLPPNFKMVVGNYVPDFLVFGLKIKGTSSVAIEINGNAHINKWEKDKVRNHHLANMKIFTFEIENCQASDLKFINEAILSMYRLRNGSLNQQILRAKRRIWIKTIACHLGLQEIEESSLKEFRLQLNLYTEAKALLDLYGCPRKLKSELTNIR